MLSVLKDTNGENNLPKELEMANAMHKKEIEDMKERTAETVQSLERQIQGLKNTNTNYENTIKQLQTTQNETEKSCEAKISEVQTKMKDVEEKLKQAIEDKAKQKEAVELDVQVRLLSLNATMDKLKASHTKELERMKLQGENSLNDIKYIYGQEKMALEARLEKAYNELKITQSNKEGNYSSLNLQDMQSNYLDEIQELNAHLGSFKKQSQEEMNSINKQRDDALNKATYLDHELIKLKEAMRTDQTMHEQSSAELSHKLEKAKSLIEANEGIQGELKRLKKQISDMKAYVTKIEGNERRLKVLLSQKESVFDSEKETLKRKLSTERKKATQAHEGCSRVKDDFDKKKMQILQELITKDEQIATLTKQLESGQGGVSSILVTL